VTRVLRLSTAFLRAYHRHGVVPGTEPGRHIASTIRLLSSSAELPAEGDLEFLMPPSLTGFLRPVPSTGFVIAYAVTDTELVILTLRVR
jgi:hypothetical protein